MRSPLPFERLRISWDAPRRDEFAPDLYRILGLHPRASDKKIKATYRKLAKRLHPDVNASDTATERQIEINRAYQILGDPKARAAYDAELALERSEARGRFWRGVAAGVGTFILTVSSGFLAAKLILHSPVPRPGGEGAVRAENRSVASKYPERDGARSGGWARPDLVGGDGDKRATPAPEPNPEQSIQQQHSAHGDVEHLGLYSEGRAASDEPPAPQPKLPSVTTPRQELGSASSPKRPAKEAPPGPAEDKLARTGAVENPVTPRIVDNEHPAPTTVSTARTVPRANPSIWKLYLNARSGFALKYPADVFPLATTNENKDRLLRAKDGRAVLHIFSMPNGATTLPEYRQSLMSGRYADASFDYVPQRSNWFVLSGTVGEEMFYERVTLSCDRRSIHGWVLVYPRAERAFYDAIGAEIRTSYRDPNARCGDLKS